MTTLIAWRNLAQDRVRLLITLTGIVLSVVLMGMQIGLLVGFADSTSCLVRHSHADLWLTSQGTKTVDYTQWLDERWRFQALAVPEVIRAEPYFVTFIGWSRPDGGTESVSLVGLETNAQLGGPWNLVEGHKEDLALPSAVIVDRLYASKLGVSAIGDSVEINGRRARVVGFTRGIRTFTQSPYVFTSIDNARAFAGAPATRAGYLLLKVDPRASVEAVRRRLQQRMPDLVLLTRDELASSSTHYWLFTTGAGISLGMSALLGLIVGIAIVAQTLYASTIDRLPEYATLKAMGAPSSYLYRIILTQASMAAAVGFALGMSLVLLLVINARSASAAPQLTPALVALLGVLTFAMCMGAAVLSIRKILTIDPVGVFR
ncbi:MAG TPA: ABC transporter permease [Polyangiales bacterium]|nr:ABC transporter permease [Polyangiales bacterium]